MCFFIQHCYNAHFTGEHTEAQSQRGHTAGRGEREATCWHPLASDHCLYGTWTGVSWLLPVSPLTKHEMSNYPSIGVSYDKTAPLHRAEAFGSMHFSGWLLFLDYILANLQSTALIALSSKNCDPCLYQPVACRAGEDHGIAKWLETVCVLGLSTIRRTEEALFKEARLW